MEKPIIYLASPYTDMSVEVMEARCRLAQEFAARMLAAGFVVFSPIAHSHGIASYLRPELRRDSSFWQSFDMPFLARCDALWVLCAPGWESSAGVNAEIKLAKELGKPVRYLAPGDSLNGASVKDGLFA